MYTLGSASVLCCPVCLLQSMHVLAHGSHRHGVFCTILLQHVAQSQPLTAMRRIAGLLWFCIPFTLATSLGLAGAALDLPITIDEASAGLVPPAVALHLRGQGGAIALTIMCALLIGYCKT